MEEKVIDKAPEHAPKRAMQASTAATWIVGVALIAAGALFLLNQFVILPNLIWSAALVGVGVLFAVVFLTDSSRWWALIPAYIFAATGLFLFVEPILRGSWDAIYWLVAVALPFITIYLLDRRRWWALIPTYVLVVTAAFLFVEPLLPGDLAAVYWMAAVGTPFLVVWATDPRKRWWALIPTYVFGMTAGFLFIEPILSRTSGELIGAFWTFAIALPFLVVYLTNPRERWWALIPGGIMAIIGAGLLISVAQFVLPAVLIVGGLILLARQFMGRGQNRTATPMSGPEADRPAE